MSSNDRIRETVSLYFSTLGARDVEAWLALFESDAIGHDPGIPPLVGHGQLRAYFNGLLDTFLALSPVHDEIFSCDSGAAVNWTIRATAKSGREIVFSGIEVFELGAGGKIQRVRAYWDPARLRAQLQA